jgi:hypothetical protein
MDSQSSHVFAWCALAVLVAGSLHAQDAGSAGPVTRTYRFTGVVTNPAREPIADAEVTLLTPVSAFRSTTTDNRGRFDLGEFAAGAISFRIRRLGYEARTVAAQIGAAGQHTPMEIALTIIPEELANVLVTDGPGRLDEFFQRRQQRAAFGHFFDQEDIRRKGPRVASDLFRSLPGASIKTNPGGGGNTIRIRNCQPMVWLDGQRSPGAELDELVSPGDIAAIEFYPSASGVPAQYLERGNRLCGLILVWTKRE